MGEIDRVLRDLDDFAHLDDESDLPPEPEGQPKHPAWNRRLKVVPAPRTEVVEGVSLDEARTMIRSSLADYLALPAPTHALLVLAAPGTGKTTLAVEAAETAAAVGRRVLYCGPRHDFYQDLQNLASHPSWWYEWLPRQLGDEVKPETCGHTPSISAWMGKGYAGIDYCRSICGWDYVNKACPYHAQKAHREPIVFGQHQHVWSGHPLPFDLLIGDESPLATFCHEWMIPGKRVYPAGLDPTLPVAEVLYALASLVTSGGKFEGLGLLGAIGGAARVREALEDNEIPIEALASAPAIHNPKDADDAPYFHLPKLATLLLREAKAAEKGEEYPHRVVVNGGHLLLLLRRRVDQRMPRHTVWLDATADPHLYEAILGRPVELVAPRVKLQGRIFQVYDRANGKGALVDGEGKQKATVQDLKRQVQRIAEGYESTAVITHMKIESELADYPTGHFFAERGTNRFEGVEALIVAGLPQPPLFQIDKAARMLFWERMRPFAPTGKDGQAVLPWSTVDKPFVYVGDDGQGRAYPSSGLWADADLKAVLYQFREAELIQAAHRARPNLRPVDVWLLENLPVDDLPPTRLMPAREIFGAPPGVNIYAWPDVLALADLFVGERRSLTPADIEEHLGIRRNTAIEYWKHIRDLQPDRWTVEPALRPTQRDRGGRPKLTLVPRRMP